MSTEAVADAPETESAAAPEQRTDCMIHVRFYPDGSVAEIGERPMEVRPQDWFNYLSNNTANCYQARSGGRGLFRLPRPEVDTLKAACMAEQAS